MSRQRPLKAAINHFFPGPVYTHAARSFSASNYNLLFTASASGRPLIARHRIRPRTNQTTRFRTFILIYRQRYESERPTTTVTINSARHACHSSAAVHACIENTPCINYFVDPRRSTLGIPRFIPCISSLPAEPNGKFDVSHASLNVRRYHVVLTFVVRPNCIQSYGREETDSEQRFHFVSCNDRILDISIYVFFLSLFSNVARLFQFLIFYECMKIHRFRDTRRKILEK